MVGGGGGTGEKMSQGGPIHPTTNGGDERPSEGTTPQFFLRPVAAAVYLSTNLIHVAWRLAI